LPLDDLTGQSQRSLSQNRQSVFIHYLYGVERDLGLRVRTLLRNRWCTRTWVRISRQPVFIQGTDNDKRLSAASL